MILMHQMFAFCPLFLLLLIISSLSALLIKPGPLLDLLQLAHERCPALVARWRFDSIRLEVSGVSALADLVGTLRDGSLGLAPPLCCCCG